MAWPISSVTQDEVETCLKSAAERALLVREKAQEYEAMATTDGVINLEDENLVVLYAPDAGELNRLLDVRRSKQRTGARMYLFIFEMPPCLLALVYDKSTKVVHLAAPSLLYNKWWRKTSKSDWSILVSAEEFFATLLFIAKADPTRFVDMVQHDDTPFDDIVTWLSNNSMSSVDNILLDLKGKGKFPLIPLSIVARRITADSILANKHNPNFNRVLKMYLDEPSRPTERRLSFGCDTPLQKRQRTTDEQPTIQKTLETVTSSMKNLSEEWAALVAENDRLQDENDELRERLKRPVDAMKQLRRVFFSDFEV